MDTNTLIRSAVLGLIALSAVQGAAIAADAAAKEKCYGVSKAGQNDCAERERHARLRGTVQDRHGSAGLEVRRRRHLRQDGRQDHAAAGQELTLVRGVDRRRRRRRAAHAALPRVRRRPAARRLGRGP